MTRRSHKHGATVELATAGAIQSAGPERRVVTAPGINRDFGSIEDQSRDKLETFLRANRQHRGQQNEPRLERVMAPMDGQIVEALRGEDYGSTTQDITHMRQISLTAADVERLARDPSPANRADAAEKIALGYSGGGLSPDERQLAEAIIDILARDAEVLVRRRLAESLKYNPELPHRVAHSLAFDLIEVAEPLLRHSVVLTDEDLIAVIGRCPVSHSRVIAGRTWLSGDVASALVATNDEQVVETLLNNRDATITEPTYHLIADSFGQLPRIMDAMSLRAGLPFGVVERIVTAVTEATRMRLVQHYGMDPLHVERLMTHARDHLMLSTVIGDADDPSLEQAVSRLYDDAKLTPSLTLRALCMGNFAFAALAMARLASVPNEKARRLLLDPGRNGAFQLYEQSRMPAQFKGLYKGVLALARWYAYVGKPKQRGPFRNRVHQWGAETLGITPSAIGFEQLITKLLMAAAEGREVAGQFTWKPPSTR
jgi:uncharacterized protein (DUF2336 family)